MKREILKTQKGEIQFYLWDQVQRPVGLVQILHGMAETMDRYDHFATFLNQKGFIVAGQMLPGHGQRALDCGELGCFEPGGWKSLLEEIHWMTEELDRRFSALPKALLAHSMGSFAARSLLFQTDPSNTFKTVILSGTGSQSGMLLKIALWLSAVEMTLSGRNSPSDLMTQLSFGQYNKKFSPTRTAFDWLTRDPEIVDDYMNSPLCGTKFSAGFYNEFFSGLLQLKKNEKALRSAYQGSLLFVSGEMDPLQCKGKTMERLIPIYKNACVGPVEAVLIPQARHEILNELNREDVYSLLERWLLRCCCS
jgi:alpha-beta hydrolase superfamily lysophospholipase